MPDYQIYKRSPEGHIQGVPLKVVVSDDEAAIRHAKFLQRGQDFEVWQGDRPVAVLTADALNTIAGNAARGAGKAPGAVQLSRERSAPAEATTSSFQLRGRGTRGPARR